MSGDRSEPLPALAVDPAADPATDLAVHPGVDPEVVDPFAVVRAAAVGAVLHLAVRNPLSPATTLPVLYRARVHAPGLSADEVWVPWHGRWERTTALGVHRSGRADDDLEVLTAADAQRLASAQAIRLAQRRAAGERG